MLFSKNSLKPGQLKLSTQNTKLLLNKSNNGEKSDTWFDDDGKKERENMHHCRLSIWLLGPSHVSP